MVLGRLFFLAFALICSLRCPLLGQSLSVSTELHKPAKAIKQFNRSVCVRDNGQTYLSLGLRYDRGSTLASNNRLELERRYMAGFPLLAGLRLGQFKLEAGGFLGVHMIRPQEANLFNQPLQSSRQINNATSLMFVMGVNVFKDSRLNLQYNHLDFDDLPGNNIHSRLNLGWQWTW